MDKKETIFEYCPICYEDHPVDDFKFSCVGGHKICGKSMIGQLRTVGIKSLITCYFCRAQINIPVTRSYLVMQKEFEDQRKMYMHQILEKEIEVMDLRNEMTETKEYNNMKLSALSDRVEAMEDELNKVKFERDLFKMVAIERKRKRIVRKKTSKRTEKKD